MGPEGQTNLADSSVLVVGCGATGGTIASLLVRAGVGRVRIVDRDFPDKGNLGRQLLYFEDDINNGLPKAEAARRMLARMNSEVKIEAVVADAAPENILDLIEGMDLIMDGVDNQEARYLINDAAVSSGLPWIFTGCVGASGNVMTIIPGKTPCLRCIFPEPAPPGALPTCDSAGIIGPAAGVAASIAAGEALKLLSRSQDASRPGFLSFDLWAGLFRTTALGRGPKPGCICCDLGRFEYLKESAAKQAEKLCGVNAVQINPPSGKAVDLEKLAEKLDSSDIVSANDYLIRFRKENCLFAVFPDGRVIIHGVSDPSRARSLYDRFVGF